jgi:hypothetical protein
MARDSTCIVSDEDYQRHWERLTHWMYPDTPQGRRSKFRAACRLLVFDDAFSNSPTCAVCRQHQQAYEDLDL